MIGAVRKLSAEKTLKQNERGHREKMADAVKRHYTFVISDAVPGGVLELRARTPAGDGRGETLDRMTLLPTDSHTPETP